MGEKEIRERERDRRECLTRRSVAIHALNLREMGEERVRKNERIGKRETET